MKRKMLAAREDLVDSLSALANRKGLTLFALTNEALEQTLRVDGMGYRLSDAVDEFEVFKTAKEAGFVLFPENLLYEVVDRMYYMDSDWMVNKWFEVGEWLGKCFSLKGFNDSVKVLKKIFRRFFWNAKDLEIVKNDDETLTVRFISPRVPESYTILKDAFLRGIFSGLGYACLGKDLAKGFIQLKFSQKVKESREQRLVEPVKVES